MSTPEQFDIEEHHRDVFLISTDRARLNLDVIHDFLANCYWCKGIPREIVARSIEHSLCFGVYDKDVQVGFARVISDFALMPTLAMCSFWKIIAGADSPSG
ncbi:MAG: GCN5-related N-acetyltransferase [Candidatus Sulfotelmatobacter sp.]|nr:GCN5-related N-acetyltransferase [Candidatus Sulfotelmatobacter sp.]